MQLILVEILLDQSNIQMEMSKFVNVTVSTSLSTDFYLEVPDNASEEQIKELAKKEVTLPHKYPEVLYNFIQSRFNLRIGGLDSMLKSWNLDEIEYIINDNIVSTEKQSNS